MALRKCRECGKDISSAAVQCPHCGVSNPTGGRGFRVGGCGGLIAGLVLLYLFVTLISTTGDRPKVSAPSHTAPTSTPVLPMPANQARLLQRFKEACRSYDAQPNEIRKSEAFRGTARFYSEVGPVDQWVGTIRRISTNQGGSKATLVIRIGSSDVYDNALRLGSPVYTAAADMREGQAVVFSGRNLGDLNLTERGKVCNPDFRVTLTSLKALSVAGTMDSIEEPRLDAESTSVPSRPPASAEALFDRGLVVSRRDLDSLESLLTLSYGRLATATRSRSDSAFRQLRDEQRRWLVARDRSCGYPSITSGLAGLTDDSAVACFVRLDSARLETFYSRLRAVSSSGL
jgi:hypothetical protein